MKLLSFLLCSFTIVPCANAQEKLDLSVATTGITLTEIPQEVFDSADELVELNLSGNKLKDLPRAVSRLTQLNELFLVESFDSLVPSDVFKPLIALPNLKSLSVSGKFLAHTDLYKLTQLEYLYWHSLENFPVAFCDMVNLRHVYLATPEKLTTLPPEFVKLGKLEKLKLGSFSLSSLPDNFGELKNLKWLDFKLSRLTRLPASFVQLTNLQHLDLEYATLAILPESFGQLKSLEDLNLAQTLVTALPHGFSNLQNLKRLDLGSSWIATLPEDIGNLKHLEYLILSSTRNLRRLPASIAQLTSLKLLNLLESSLPDFPEQVFALKDLKTLYVSQTDLDRWQFEGTNQAKTSQLPRLCSEILTFSTSRTATYDLYPASLHRLSLLQFLFLRCITIFTSMQTSIVRSFLAVVFIALTTSASFGQKSTITKAEVDRILKTLSSDDKMGRPAMNPALMEKSIAFIESEFKRIGLAPLDGLTSFRQEFTQDAIALENVSVTANGKSIPRENIIVYSARPQFQWNTVANIQRIKKGDNAFQSFGKISRDTTDGVVLIDTAHTNAFNELKSYFSGKRILNPSRKYGSKLFVLTTDTVFATPAVSVLQRMDKLVLTNVAGQIKAAKQTKESVIFSAHYDHLGIQTPVDGDSIANGADDDASGTTAVIMLADHFKKEKKLTRNLIFVAFTAEEIGGYGSKYFSTKITPTDIVAMVNIEMIGKLSKWGAKAAFISGFERSDFGTILQKNLAGTGVEFHPDPYPEQNLFYRSDNATLARLGVPAHTLSTDQIDSDKLYHTVNDEFESIDTQNMADIIRAIATSASTLVTGNASPTRIDTSKVE